MSPSAEKTRDGRTDTDDDGLEGSGRSEEIRRIANQVKKHIEVTFDQTKAASAKETQSLISGLDELKRNPGKIDDWDGFIDWSVKAMASSIKLAQDLKSRLDTSVSSKWISSASREKWMKRFTDSNVDYRKKEYWIQNQLPHYVEAWKNVAEERTKLARDPSFKDLIATYSEFAVLQDSQQDKFLSMHFDARKNLIKEARAALVSINSGQSSYYTEAKTALYAAVSKGVLSAAKVGVWLQRIFKKGWSGEHIEKFIRGGIPNSLPALVENWTKVKARFDNAMKKARERGEDLDARGYPMLTDAQFLSLPFEQRVHYVKELESRLDDAKNVASERPIFIRIRHAMDTKDWEDASMLIAQAKADQGIQGKDRSRLLSMESFCKKFAKNTNKASSMEQLVSAKKRMDTILHDLGQSHSQVEPLVSSLAKGMYGNRSLHQFRWIVYNNKWCRGRGYLNDTVARKGASKENEELTKQRALQGEDIGRHDVISYETSGEQFIRKKEKANHKATYRHVNVKDGAAVNKTKEWLSREQDPKVLYWTTFCGHEDGEPKPEGWHNDLLNSLTELRGLSRTMDAAGVVYNGRNDALTRKGAVSKSLAA